MANELDRDTQDLVRSLVTSQALAGVVVTEEQATISVLGAQLAACRAEREDERRWKETALGMLGQERQRAGGLQEALLAEAELRGKAETALRRMGARLGADGEWSGDEGVARLEAALAACREEHKKEVERLERTIAMWAERSTQDRRAMIGFQQARDELGASYVEVLAERDNWRDGFYTAKKHWEDTLDERNAVWAERDAWKKRAEDSEQDTAYVTAVGDELTATANELDAVTAERDKARQAAQVQLDVSNGLMDRLEAVEAERDTTLGRVRALEGALAELVWATNRDGETFCDYCGAPKEPPGTVADKAGCSCALLRAALPAGPGGADARDDVLWAQLEQAEETIRRVKGALGQGG